MANRRLLEQSRHQFALMKTGNLNEAPSRLDITTSIFARRLFLSLAIVSCLISINCASLVAHQSRIDGEKDLIPREWYQGSPNDQDLEVDNDVSREAYLREFLSGIQTLAKQAKTSSSLDDSRADVQYLPRPKVQEQAIETNIDYIDPKIQFDYLPQQQQRELLVSLLPSRRAYTDRAKSFQKYLAEKEKINPEIQRSLSQELELLDAKILELLKDEKSSTPKTFNDPQGAAHQPDYEVDLVPNARSSRNSLTDPSNFYLSDNLRDVSNNIPSNSILVQGEDDITAVDTNPSDNRAGQSNDTNEPILNDRDLINTVSTYEGPENVSNQTKELNNVPASTLLEDEEDEKAKIESKSSNDNSSRSDRSTKLSQEAPSVSYGSMVDSPGQSDSRRMINNDEAGSKKSIFGRLYDAISYYVPFVKNLYPFGSHESPSDTSSTNVRSSPFEPLVPNRKLVGSLWKPNSGEEFVKISGPADSKSEVGVLSSSGNSKNDLSTDKVTTSESAAADNDEDKNVTNAPAKAELNENQKVDSNDNTSTEGSTNKRSQDGIEMSPSVIVSAPAGEVEIEHKIPVGDGLHRVSLNRQSNLVMPLRSNDEVLFQSTPRDEASPTSGDDRSSNIVGKYIYVPEQHYMLKGPSKTQELNMVDDDANRRYYAPMAHRSYAIHHDDGADIPGSYIRMKPVYFAHKDDEAGTMAMNGKSNDIYFLVMVSAFCLMAVAVVMSAGIFAYRVQQQRKSSSEQDYPTYGVVGPNNMNGNCILGAGGYFPGNVSNMSGHSGALNGNAALSKMGGSKQSDLFNPNLDNGMSKGGHHNEGSRGPSSGIDSGSTTAGNSTFLVNQNVARMYHYQHQKQQMISSDRASAGRHTSASDLDSEDENDDGSYTVYECPGLASAHEMEIKNPLFNDDRSP